MSIQLTSLATASLAASEEFSPPRASEMMRIAAACAWARISITATSPWPCSAFKKEERKERKRRFD